jgi:hypothetical protein
MTNFDPIRTLLEDFEAIGGEVLVRRRRRQALLRDIRAALVASQLGLKSLDHAKRRYVDEFDEVPDMDDTQPQVVKYIEAYQAAKAYVMNMLSKLTTVGRPDPSVGEFGASIVLERLPHSFFCAHLLYRLGYRYEGHAVARLILEQIAWAYAAHHYNDMLNIENIVTTKSINELKRFAPSAGHLYGFLSQKTHIDFGEHSDFFRIVNGKGTILFTQSTFSEYAKVILELADIFGAVWEATQRNFIDDLQAVVVSSGQAVLHPDRPFRALAKQISRDFEQFDKQMADSSNNQQLSD